MNENIDLKVANEFASELLNENVQLRQLVIRQRVELEGLRPKESEGETDEE